MIKKSDRISIMIDSNLVKKIRGIQGSRIKQNKKNVTFSQVVEDLIRKSLKNIKYNKLIMERFSPFLQEFVYTMELDTHYIPLAT